MIQSQYEKVKSHILEQFRSITRSKKEKIKEIVEDHFFDLEHDNKIQSEFIGFSKKPFQEIGDSRDRAIYILMVSRAFSKEEIASVLNISSQTVSKIYKKIKKNV